MTTPIPQPPGLPLLGNILTIDQADVPGSLARLNAQYGEIFKLSVAGTDRYFACSERLVRELCDETRFVKSVSGALDQVRNGVGDGLFTAHHGEHNWEIAHRTLVPSFGPIGIMDMWDEMYDIATQLVAKWARVEADTLINVTDDFTRLTLDSIALTAMDKRFNSFYQEDMHPFVTAMTEFLAESGVRQRRTRLQALLSGQANYKYEQNIALMKSVAQEVIDRRRRTPSQKKDLLNAMLFGKDPKTGEQLSDESIMNNMITFLIAGHETTSGLLSFTTYYLLKNPEALSKATQEVDTVIGRGSVKYEHMSKLPYLEAVLRESLRLSPTAPAFTIKPKPGTKDPVLIGGEYLIPPDASIVCWLPQVHRDIKVYGEDAEEFRPERMSKDNFAQLSSGAWKPFGNGARGCIGRPFAWQEALLALALVLQNFNIRLADPSYQLKIKQTLTIKPDGLFIKISPRPGVDTVGIERRMYGDAKAAKVGGANDIAVEVDKANLKPMTVLYGSNSGTCEGLAQKLGASAIAHGFTATVKSLDAAVERLPINEATVLISASYEGLPPDNAAQFVQWVKTAPPDNFKNTQFAVFGCGHEDWVSTYQKIPTLLDNVLAERGGSAIIPRGETNVAAGRIFDDFDSWTDKLWEALGSTGSAVAEGLDMDLSNGVRASHLRYSVRDALVLKNELLTAKDTTPEKRYIEFKLPTNTTYDAGDYLALLPLNQLSVVSRVLRRFKLPWDATMTLKKSNHSTIPSNVSLSVSVVLASYVELNTTATKKNIQTIAKFSTTNTLDTDTTTTKSPLDILEAHPDIDIPFSVYLSMLPPMRLRQYSISSSPLADPTIASITFSLASDNDASNAHLGVATHYLKSLLPGSTTQLSIRKSPAPFHPPSDPTIPIVMIAAGTGLAPFRGFIQDRAVRMSSPSSQQTSFAPAVLLVGCRDPEHDRIHGAELDAWEKQGAVKVYYAYSRASDLSEGCRYAQDRLWREREEIGGLFDQGAKVFICGSSRLGKGVEDVVVKMYTGAMERKGKAVGEEEARKWWSGLRGERYAVDVFD